MNPQDPKDFEKEYGDGLDEEVTRMVRGDRRHDKTDEKSSSSDHDQVPSERILQVEMPNGR